MQEIVMTSSTRVVRWWQALPGAWVTKPGGACHHHTTIGGFGSYQRFPTRQWVLVWHYHAGPAVIVTATGTRRKS